MAKPTELMILGSKAIRGSIEVSGAKNAALPLMAACLLTDKDVKLTNVPKIDDVEEMKKLLIAHGVRIEGEGTSKAPLVLNASKLHVPGPASDAGKNIRGAVFVVGPLVARSKQPVKVRGSGGCKIDGKEARATDYHVNALTEKMGAKLKLITGKEGKPCQLLQAERALHGATVKFNTGEEGEMFPNISVSTTENIMMAACLATGDTTIINAAMGPEVLDLADLLKEMKANVEVIKEKKTIIIQGNGRNLLSGTPTPHRLIPDRIEAGTYAIAAAITGGSLLLKMNPVIAKIILIPVIEKLKKAGVDVIEKDNGLQIQKQKRGRINPVSITTGPYPKFPTDLLPQWVTLMTQADGDSRIEDTIYKSRFNHVPHLKKMEANITEESQRVYIVHGKTSLRGTHVAATDLRAGVALVLAGLAAEGATVVEEIHHLFRGYDNLKEKLKQCGAMFEELPPTRPGHYGYSQ